MEDVSSLPHARGVVLVVDDEPLLRRLLTRTLTMAGLAVIEAENGEVGLEVARASQVPLTLVITDLSMPVMGGLEFARRFRLLNSSVPILLMSGHFDSTAPDGCSQLEAELFLLRKPFTSSSLLALVTYILGASTPDSRSRTLAD